MNRFIVSLSESYGSCYSHMNIHKHGIEIRKRIVSNDIIESIKAETASLGGSFPTHGIRNAEKKFGSIEKLVSSDNLKALTTGILGSSPKLVRCIFFDKTPKKNWLVTWHQDKTIALNKKVEIEGWGPWSLKDNTFHVQPSLEVLNKMITLRLHLDNSDTSNGCLKVIPTTHELGILSQAEIAEVTSTQRSYSCEVKQGDMVIMRPHILHASTKSIKPSHRRVVHMEYSDYALPYDLHWA